MKVTRGHIERAVGRHMNLGSGLLVPEACVSYVTGISKWANGEYEQRKQYLADLLWVTKAGYATEFEIKVSRSDWRADDKKEKWGYLPPWISRFIYVVPEELGIPDFVRPEAGIWHFNNGYHWHSAIKVARAPRRIGWQKVPNSEIDRWLRHLYFRFWQMRNSGERNLPSLETVAA